MKYLIRFLEQLRLQNLTIIQSAFMTELSFSFFFIFKESQAALKLLHFMKHLPLLT